MYLWGSQLSLFNRDIPILTQNKTTKTKKREEKHDFYLVSLFKKSVCSNVYEIQEYSYFWRLSSHLSLSFRFQGWQVWY